MTMRYTNPRLLYFTLTTRNFVGIVQGIADPANLHCLLADALRFLVSSLPPQLIS